MHHLGSGAHLTWSFPLLEDFMVRGTHAQFVGEIRGEVGPGGGILHVGQTTYQVGPGGISCQGHSLKYQPKST